MEPTVTITPSNCARFDNALHAQFHNQTYAIIAAEELSRLHVDETLLAEWRSFIDTEIDINNEARANADTAKAVEKDAERDNLLSYLFGTIRNEALSPVPARQAAAGELAIVADKYNGLQGKAFDEETLLITGLLTDLRKEPLAAHAATLGLTEVITALEVANTEYQALRTARTESRAAGKLPAAKEIRPQTDARYNRVCQLVEASYLLSTVEEDRAAIATLVDRLNQYISETKTTWKQMEAQRKTAKEKAAATEDATGNPEA